MITGDAVWQGALYSVDSDNLRAAAAFEEELLTPIEVTRKKGMILVTWLWLTGADAGTIFLGQPLSFNQEISVTRVL